MGSASNKTIVSSRIFGNMVDYFLLSVKTKDTIFTLAERLSDHCNCRFAMMPSMRVAESAECPMRPEFRMLYAQYESTGLEDSFAMDPVDRLNIVLFQNKAISFDKSKSALAETDHNGAFPFIDEGCDCYAFSPHGVNVGKCTPADFADYYILRVSWGADIDLTYKETDLNSILRFKLIINIRINNTVFFIFNLSTDY